MSNFYQRAPYGNVWPFPDGRVLLSPTLAKTGFTESRDLAPLMIQLMDMVNQAQPIETGTPCQLLAAMLTRQGYLQTGVAEREPARYLEEVVLDGVPWSIWSGFCYDEWIARDEQLQREGAEKVIHAFLGDGEGLAWVYAREVSRHSCLDCFLRRWLAHKPSPAQELLLEGRRMRWKPAAEASQVLKVRYEWGAVKAVGEAFAVPVLPVPACPRCRDRVLDLRPKARNQGLRGPHFGLLTLAPSGPSNEGLHSCRARVCGQEWLTLAARAPAEGQGFSIASARDRAIKKALEGYCAACFNPDRWLPEPSGPRLYSSEPGPWTAVTRWGKPDTVWAPFSRILLGAGEGDVLNGLEAAESTVQAFECGLQECLERDALALFWGRLGSGMKNAAVRATLPEELASHLQSLPVKVHYLHLPSQAGTTTLVILEDERGRPACGSAYRFVPMLAAEKALSEALHNYERLRRGSPCEGDFAPTGFAGHRRYFWDHPERFPWAALRALPNYQASRSRIRDLGVLLHELEVRGQECYFVDLTTSDVRSLGYNVGRVLCPEWLYLPPEEAAWPVGLERWVRMVGSEAPLLPHPFG